MPDSATTASGQVSLSVAWHCGPLGHHDGTGIVVNKHRQLSIVAMLASEDPLLCIRNVYVIYIYIYIIINIYIYTVIHIYIYVCIHL